MTRPRCLIVDYGGVLTTPIGHSWRLWAHEEGLDVELFEQVIAEIYEGGSRAEYGRAIELGEVSEAELEHYLSERLRRHDGEQVLPAGLLDRLWAALRGEPDMVGVVRRARDHGLPTALLSNSWGMGYDRTDWDRLFDAVVISGEVRLRKPDPAIYRHTAKLLQVEPAECVFVDDTYENVRGAAAVGMVAVHHIDIESTIFELETLLRVPLR